MPKPSTKMDRGIYYYKRKVVRCQEGVEEMGRWLNRFEWEWFFTGTFRPQFENISTIGIKHCFFSFLNHIFEKENKYAYFFMSLEIQGNRMIPHIHSLIKFNSLGNKNEIIRKDWWKYWFDKYGRCRIEPFNKEYGAGYYLSKYIYKPDKLVDWDICLTLDNWLEIRKDYLNYKVLTLDKNLIL